jgi:hypothetical protein
MATIKLVKKKGKQGRHFLRENASPTVLANRTPEAMAIVRSHRGQKRALKDITQEVLNSEVTINGEKTNLTVAEKIITQRAVEAMQENDVRGLAMVATEFLFDRAEGKAASKTELSGPEGGPIEVVQEHRVLAKLFS